MPQTISAVYLSSRKAATDPRFMKLAPVFRCSNLKCGDTQRLVVCVHLASFCLFGGMEKKAVLFVFKSCAYIIKAYTTDFRFSY